MGFFDFLTGGASDLVKSVGDAIDKNVTSDEERMTLRNELSKINAEFITKVQEFEAKQAEITAKDRETARLRETELAKAGKANYNMIALVILALAGLSWVTWFVFTKDIRERDITMMVVGFLISLVKDIYGYYFGSSYGSSVKNDIINKLRS